jgi:hypothetical protein
VTVKRSLAVKKASAIPQNPVGRPSAIIGALRLEKS